MPRAVVPVHETASWCRNCVMLGVARCCAARGWSRHAAGHRGVRCRHVCWLRHHVFICEHCSCRYWACSPCHPLICPFVTCPACCHSMKDMSIQVGLFAHGDSQGREQVLECPPVSAGQLQLVDVLLLHHHCCLLCLEPVLGERADSILEVPLAQHAHQLGVNLSSASHPFPFPWARRDGSSYAILPHICRRHSDSGNGEDGSQHYGGQAQLRHLPRLDVTSLSESQHLCVWVGRMVL